MTSENFRTNPMFLRNQFKGDGKQWWVRFREQTINEGGLNQYPRPWDPESGLNKNPFKLERRKNNE